MATGSHHRIGQKDDPTKRFRAHKDIAIKWRDLDLERNFRGTAQQFGEHTSNAQPADHDRKVKEYSYDM